MRFSILAVKDGTPVINSVDYHHAAQMFLSDRVANKEAFPGEKIFRLPRKMCQTKSWHTISQIISRLNQWSIQ